MEVGTTPPSKRRRVKANASSLLAELRAGDPNATRRGLGGLLELARQTPDDVMKLPDLEQKLDKVVKSFAGDVEILSETYNLLNMKEETVSLSQKPRFKYPPFQKALPYFPSNCFQLLLKFQGQLTSQLHRQIMDVLQALKDYCDHINGPNPKTGLVTNRCDFNVGFGLDFWNDWCNLLKRPLPVPLQDAIDLVKPDKNMVDQHPKLTYDTTDMWFYLKADSAEDCKTMTKTIKSALRNEIKDKKVLKGYKKSGNRIFGGQFQDGVSNAVDPLSIIRSVVLTGIPTPAAGVSCDGGTFAFTQTFLFDVDTIENSADPVKEVMIGRDTLGRFLPHMDEQSHIKRARFINSKTGSNVELLRQALSFQSKRVESGPVEKGLLFVAFTKSFQDVYDILDRLLGKPHSAFPSDLLMKNVLGKSGTLVYCPSAKELPIHSITDKDEWPLIPYWFTWTSENEYLFYNHIQYLHAMATGLYKDEPPSRRILYLLSEIFARWHSSWHHKCDVPRLPHLNDVLRPDEQHIMDAPIQIRKGYSYRKMLGEVLTSRSKKNGYGRYDQFDSYHISPKELIVGSTDRLSFGSGKEVMPYIKENERELSWDLGLTEAGNMGHIVPGHKYILDLGVGGMLQTLHAKLNLKGLDDDQKVFYQSAIYAYEGVQLYLLRYAKLAQKTAKRLDPESSLAKDRANMRDVARRMVRLATGKPESFHDAVQMIFSMHCCLHLVGQPVSVGNIDRLLISYYKQDIQNGTLTPKKAQKIIDNFFIKFSEHVVLNKYNIPYGHVTYGSTCVTGRGGIGFPTGDSMNQWIQQLTVGGYGADGKDMCNEVTLMCLKASRRLPLNSPCLSLRLTPHTPEAVKEEAAKAILSGGAHPILFCDDKMIPGLLDSLKQSFSRAGVPEPRDLEAVAREYSCDGCYEPMFTGRSEFKFAYVSLPQAIVYAINCGMNYQPAGPLYLAGGTASYRTPLPEEIKTFDQFKEIFVVHLHRLVENLYGLIVNSYGNPWKICPSPLLSCLMEGCMESGRDLTNGGTRFRIMTPMFIGFANTINSLYNVKKMVYDANNVTTLETLRMALINNWGENMVEPFYGQTGEDAVHTEMWAQRFKDLRFYANGLPKFGTDTADAEVH